jgi:hypothetical protein
VVVVSLQEPVVEVVNSQVQEVEVTSPVAVAVAVASSLEPVVVAS